MRVVATIEARMAATRLPGKVMLPLAGAPMLQRLVERVRHASCVDDVVVATTINAHDAVIADLCARIGCNAHRGPIEDITLRLLEAARGADLIVQITGDCPLVDPAHIDRTVQLLLDRKADFASNSLHQCTFPLGFDVRAFTMAALMRTDALTSDPIDRVHGSYFIYRRPDLFRLVGWEAPPDQHWPELRLTVDEPADYELVRRVFEELYPTNALFDTREIIDLLRRRVDWVALNSSVRQKVAAEG
jgi:spore coat polysaccharide biosynthesis protein SpsF